MNKRPSRLLPSVLWRVLPLAICALAGSWYFASEAAQRTVETELQQRLSREATQAASAVSLKLQAVVDAAGGLAKNGLIVNALFDVEERLNYLPTFFQSLSVPGPPGAIVTLADYKGRTIASNRKGITYKNRPFVPRVMAGKEVVRITGAGLFVALPVHHAGQPEGILVVEHQAGNLPGLLALVSQSDTVEVQTDAGTVLYSSVSASSPASGEAHHASGWVVAEIAVPQFPALRLHVAERKETALAPVRRLAGYMLAAVFFSVAAVTIGIGATAYLVTKPLARFIDGISTIGNAHSLSYRMTADGAAEFHTLTKTFNAMLENLEATTTSRDYSDGVLDSLHEILLVTDSKGFITRFNAMALESLGYSAEDLTAIHIRTIIFCATDDVQKLQSQELASVEGIATTSGGKTLPVLISASSFSGDSADRGTIYVITDITERKLVENKLEHYAEELARSNQDLEQFAAVASHDLQEPLRKVQVFSDLFREDYSEALDNEGLDYLDRIQSATARMQVLINDLLRFARVGKDGQSFVPVDLNEIVRGVVTDLDVLIEEIGAEVDVGPLPWVSADPLQMRQLFQNVIGNGLKYRREGAAPVVRVAHDSQAPDRSGGNHPSDDSCVITISDNGIGFDQDYAERIFGVFQRLHGRSVYEGTGIGLAVCRRICERHDGSITAQSESGVGATFTITLREERALQQGYAA